MNMKIILAIFLYLVASASAQTAAVTKNSITGLVNGNLTIGGNNSLSVNGTLTTSSPPTGLNTATPLLWASVQAQTSIKAGTSRHGLIVRSPAGTANAIVGWSSSGAVAGKFYQDTSYTAPAVYVGRAETSATIPTLQIGAATGNATHTAIQVANIGSSTSAFSVAHNGAIVNTSSAPSTIGGVVLSNGAVSAASVTAAIGNVSAAGRISAANYSANVCIRYSTVAPNGSVTGNPGDICIQVTGGNATLHFKPSGTATNTGWVAK